MKIRARLLTLIILLTFISPTPAQAQSGAYKIFTPLAINAARGMIAGTVTFRGAPAAGIPVYLLKKVYGPTPTVEKLFTDAQGRFAFYDPPLLPAGDQYVVMYVNNDEYLGKLPLLSFYQSPAIDYRAGDITYLAPFEIANISLDWPIYGARSTFPVTFSWQPRGFKTDQYVFWIAEYSLGPSVDAVAAFTSPQLGAASSYTLDKLPPGFSLRPHCVWGVYVYAADGGFGSSYDARWIFPEMKTVYPLYAPLVY